MITEGGTSGGIPHKRIQPEVGSPVAPRTHWTSTLHTTGELPWLPWVSRCEIRPLLISYSNCCPLGRATERLLQVIHKFFSTSRVYCYFKNELWFIALQQKPNF